MGPKFVVYIHILPGFDPLAGPLLHMFNCLGEMAFLTTIVITGKKSLNHKNKFSNLLDYMIS